MVALDDVSLSVVPGELLVIMGPSGAGKSTLLRVVAGLDHLDAGRLLIDGTDMTHASPVQRDVAMVFQEPALYPHLSVEANIGFGLRAQGMKSGDIRPRVEAAAEALSLGPLLRRRPGELSGGERQRVGLARALVRKPRVFLMDEPLSSLDSELRGRARLEIKNLQAQLGTTTIYVTHDRHESMTLGHRLAVLRGGRLEQIGTPLELFDHPRSAFVARALGDPPMNIIPGHLVPACGKLWAGIRPDRLTLADSSEVGDNALHGVVEAVELTGTEAVVHVRVEGRTVLVGAERGLSAPMGKAVALSFAPADVHGFDQGP